MASNMCKNLIKKTLETKSTKRVENVLNLLPADLQETRFRIEGVPKITKARGADKYKTIPKSSVEMKPTIHEKSIQELNKKQCLKTEPHKLKNTPNISSKWDPKSAYILGEMHLGAPLVAQAAFVIKKWAPSAPKVRSRIAKCAKNDTKELSECENDIQKWTLFGARRK